MHGDGGGHLSAFSCFFVLFSHLLLQFCMHNVFSTIWSSVSLISTYIQRRGKFGRAEGCLVFLIWSDGRGQRKMENGGMGERKASDTTLGGGTRFLRRFFINFCLISLLSRNIGYLLLPVCLCYAHTTTHRRGKR